MISARSVLLMSVCSLSISLDVIIVTSSDELMFHQRLTVRLSVCPSVSVCLLTTHVKATDRIFIEMLS